MHARLELTKEICGNSILFVVETFPHQNNRSLDRSVGPCFDFLWAKVTLTSQSHCLQREDIASTVSSYTE